MSNHSRSPSNENELPAFLNDPDASASPAAAATAKATSARAGAAPANAAEMLAAPPLEEFTSDVGSIASFLPDTPWTTTAVHACDRRRARVWVDSLDMPQNVAVVTPGDPDHGLPPTAYLFGSEAAPDPLVRFVNDYEGPLDVVCDDAMSAALTAALPDLGRRECAVRWFERLDSVERPDLPGLRRLRLKDEAAVRDLAIPGLLRTFETVKDVLMGGGASGIVADGQIQAAAFTVDQTVNYARILVCASDSIHNPGVCAAAVRHIVAAHHEQGRLACIVVESTDHVGEGVAAATGFEAAARMTVHEKR